MPTGLLVSLAALSMMLTLITLSPTAQAHTATVAQASQTQTQPSPDEVKAAIKKGLQSANLTMPQKRQVRGMVQNYESQTAGADDATKKAAAQTLLKNIYGILTPQQQSTFKASMKQSLGGAMP